MNLIRRSLFACGCALFFAGLPFGEAAAQSAASGLDGAASTVTVQFTPVAAGVPGPGQHSSVAGACPAWYAFPATVSSPQSVSTTYSDFITSDLTSCFSSAGDYVLTFDLTDTATNTSTHHYHFTVNPDTATPGTIIPTITSTTSAGTPVGTGSDLFTIDLSLADPYGNPTATTATDVTVTFSDPSTSAFGDLLSAPASGVTSFLDGLTLTNSTFDPATDTWTSDGSGSPLTVSGLIPTITSVPDASGTTTLPLQFVDTFLVDLTVTDTTTGTTATIPDIPVTIHPLYAVTPALTDPFIFGGSNPIPNTVTTHGDTTLATAPTFFPHTTVDYSGFGFPTGLTNATVDSISGDFTTLSTFPQSTPLYLTGTSPEVYSTGLDLSTGSIITDLLFADLLAQPLDWVNLVTYTVTLPDGTPQPITYIGGAAGQFDSALASPNTQPLTLPDQATQDTLTDPAHPDYISTLIGYSDQNTPVDTIGADIEGQVVGDPAKLGLLSRADYQAQLLGDFTTTDVTRTIRENAYQLIRGRTSLSASGGNNWNAVMSALSSSTVVVASGDITLTPVAGTPIPGGQRTLIIHNGNLRIGGTGLTATNSTDTLGIILLSDTPPTSTGTDTGNIFLADTVHTLDGVFFADGSLMRSSSHSTTGCTQGIATSPTVQTLLRGNLFSRNTIGGSMIAAGGDYVTPWGPTTDKAEATCYDLHFISQYYNPSHPSGSPTPHPDHAGNPNAFIIRLTGQATQYPPPGFRAVAPIIRE